MMNENRSAQNRALVQRLHDEVFGNRNLDVVDDLVADDYVLHGPDGDQDRDAYFRQNLPQFWQGFPDLLVLVEDTLADDDRVVIRFSLRGTHQGEFRGIPATDNCISMSGTLIERVADSKIVERWLNRDDLGLMQQLGVGDTPETLSAQAGARPARPSQAEGDLETVEETLQAKSDA